jgi:hypothetical protein
MFLNVVGFWREQKSPSNASPVWCNRAFGGALRVGSQLLAIILLCLASQVLPGTAASFRGDPLHSFAVARRWVNAILERAARSSPRAICLNCDD